MTGPCNAEGCDCGHTIEQLQAENARLREAIEKAVYEYRFLLGMPAHQLIVLESALAGKEVKHE